MLAAATELPEVRARGAAPAGTPVASTAGVGPVNLSGSDGLTGEPRQAGRDNEKLGLISKLTE